MKKALNLILFSHLSIVLSNDQPKKQQLSIIATWSNGQEQSIEHIFSSAAKLYKASTPNLFSALFENTNMDHASLIEMAHIMQDVLKKKAVLIGDEQPVLSFSDTYLRLHTSYACLRRQQLLIEDLRRKGSRKLFKIQQPQQKDQLQ